MLATETQTTVERYAVKAEQYTLFRQQGFLVVRNLVSPEEIAELKQHTEDLMQGLLPEQQLESAKAFGLSAPPPHLPPHEKAQHYLRIHMLHRVLGLHERYLLHPRVLDVLECLIGPDVLALQTMLFLKPPGKPGQGWHQDTFYIPTHPDTLCGAWIAIDDCDELNGAMWMAAGSGAEPIYPSADGHFHGNKNLSEILHVNGVSDVDDSKNDLAKIADRYPQLLVPAKAGDVVFFNGHVLHRSKQNYSTDRFRRSFVSHYCNARSFTQWGSDERPARPGEYPPVDPVNGGTNGSHILARGDTHLPFAQPKFGTPCAAQLTKEERTKQSHYAASMMANMASGSMDARPADPTIQHDHREGKD